MANIFHLFSLALLEQSNLIQQLVDVDSLDNFAFVSKWVKAIIIFDKIIIGGLKALDVVTKGIVVSQVPLNHFINKRENWKLFY